MHICKIPLCYYNLRFHCKGCLSIHRYLRCTDRNASINKVLQIFCGYIFGDGKCGFLEVRAPRKSWRSESQSESKGPHCYGPCSHVPAGLPRGEVTERSEDQGEGKGPHRYGPCSPSPVCASPWAKCGRGDTTFRPDFFINS